ncbi:MAG: TRAP transporter substrate-binding protein DctP [Gammaproteobacteria bacterium]
MNRFIQLVMLVLLFAVSSQQGFAKTLKIATIVPAGTTWMKELKKGADAVKLRTDGRVKIKYYPGGVMGNEQSVHRKIKIGQLQGGAFTSGGLAQVYPDIQSLSLPMLFDSFEEVDYVRARIDPVLKRNIEKSGFVLLGISEGGFARILSQTPLRDLESIRLTRVWIPEGDYVVRETFKTLGISPVSLPISDVFTGLQTGLIETIAVNPTAAIAFQWHTKMNYMTETPLIYLIGTLAVQKKVFDQLKAEDQAVLREEIGLAFERLDRLNRSDNKSATEALANLGIQFVRPDAAELARWKSLSAESIDVMIQNGGISQTMVDDIRRNLAEFRSQ